MKAIILSAIELEIRSLYTNYEIILTGVGKINAALSALKTIVNILSSGTWILGLWART